MVNSATIIGISGKQFAGKDTLTDMLLENLPGWRRLPIAQAIKLEYAQQLGVSVAQIEANKSDYRPGLIAHGNYSRQTHPDYWLDKVFELFQAEAPSGVIVSDVRLQREVAYLKEQGALLIRVEASREARRHRGLLISENDATECELDDYNGWDIQVPNHGSVEELHRYVNETLLIQLRQKGVTVST
jgi:phosphomevalonate kinase